VSSGAVLLINPRTASAKSSRMPLSLVHLAAALEGHRPWDLVDANVVPDPVRTALERLAARPHALVAVTVMPGPQVVPAIEISSAIRAAYPALPIVWGGYFPTLYPDAAINAPYVDYVVRGQGEGTLVDLLSRLPDAGPPGGADSARDLSTIRTVAGLTWKQEGHAIHNPDRALIPPTALPLLPYELLKDVKRYLRPSFMGARTTVYQSAIGCRYKCNFCGVVSMWNGKTHLDLPDRMWHALSTLRDRWGADSVQFFDHNFFDKEESSVPALEVLAKLGMPWWCWARADTLANFSSGTWEKIRASRLRMAYIGAEAADDETLRRMRKGSRVEHTLEVARRARAYGMIPEFSFILGAPEDPEGQIETTFEFIRKIKSLNPEAEFTLYFYSPTPQRQRGARSGAASGVTSGEGPRLPILNNYGPSGPALPTTPEEWAQPQWINWICHNDAPWLTPRIRRRVKDFARVIACRFPTVQDARISGAGRALLRNLARWRYATRHYDYPFELRVARRLVRLREPKAEGI
jgi:anaerobic magnesium-protoporphyrin IX monomethyl ester cyclase